MVINIFMFILPAQNEPKGAAVYLVRQRRTTLRSSQRTGDIGKSHALRRVADLSFISLLGGVKWQSKKHFVEIRQKPLYL